MTNTIFSSDLANEIVRSWSKKRSNFIIVAPPMSNIRSLFSQICDVDFIRSILDIQADAIVVAKLDTSDFKDDLTFAKRVLRNWNVKISTLNGESDAVALLNAGTNELNKSGKIPVIVIHRFHEALEKLGEEIGTALRNLEHDYNLKTVVELPISLTYLRERWDAMDMSKPPFLASDWGQGHSLKFLKGYSLGEIISLLPKIDSSNESAEVIFQLSGGIVGLVEHLIEPAGAMNVRALREYAKSKSVALCDRLITWIDKPKEDFFKRLVVRTLACPGAKQGATSLNDHDWRDLLIRKDGSINCLMIGWACSEKLAASNMTSYVGQLTASLKDGHAAEVIKFIDNLLPGERISAEKQEALILLCKFYEVAGPYIDDWKMAREILKKFSILVSLTSCPDIRLTWNSLELWLPLANLMCDFAYAKKQDANIRLEEFSVGVRSPTDISALLQLLHLRLEKAAELTPYLALKSIVEQPESLLQLYSHVRIELCFWKFQGISDCEVTMIASLIKKPFRAPKNNSRLGFIEILYLTFLKLDTVPKEERLFDSYPELQKIETLYEERKQQVHSTAVVSAEDWDDYAKLCKDWLLLLWKISGNPNQINLPRTIDIFSMLAKSLYAV